MRVGCAGEAVSSNLTPVVDTVPHQEFVARSAVYGGPTEFHAVLCRLRGQHRRREDGNRWRRCGRRVGCRGGTGIAGLAGRGCRRMCGCRRGRRRVSRCRCRRRRGHIVGPCACFAVGVGCTDGVEVSGAGDEVAVRVGCAGEAVSSNLAPVVDTVPHQEFVARSAVYGGPTEFHTILRRLRRQHRRSKGGNNRRRRCGGRVGGRSGRRARGGSAARQPEAVNLCFEFLDRGDEQDEGDDGGGSEQRGRGGSKNIDSIRGNGE